MISGDREGRVAVEVLGGKTELEVTEDIREGKKTEFEEGQVTVDVPEEREIKLEERQVETDVTG